MMVDTVTTQRLFEVAPEKLKPLHAILALLKNILEDEVIFSIAEEGLRVRQMDKGRFMLVELHIPSSFFAIFTPIKEITPIELSIEDLARKIGLQKKDDKLTFELSETSAAIILDNPQFLRTSFLPVTITGEENSLLNAAGIELAYQGRISRKAFSQTITMLVKQHPEANVMFEGQEDAIHFTVSQAGKERVSFQHPIESFGEISETRVLFPLGYLKHALINDPMFDDTLALALENNKPLRIRYSNAEEVELILLLAPIAEAYEEEDDEEEEDEWEEDYEDEEDEEINRGEDDNE